jgi:sulfate permease, SulP family
VLDAETLPCIDVTAAGVLEQTVRDLEHQGVRLFVARDIGPVCEVLREAGAGRELTTVYASVELAVEAAAASSGAKPGA